jgi:DNA-binding transcriptional LysR family regulator
MEAFRSRIDGIHDKMGGELHIAVFDKTATNPQARLGDAIRQFADEAPDVALNLHVASINEVERGIIDGSYQVGIIPAHRSRQPRLCGTVRRGCCCTAAASIRSTTRRTASSRGPRSATMRSGLGFHSPNMELSHRAKLTRSATASDQESIATLILSGRYLGFLPDHYAESFENKG